MFKDGNVGFLSIFHESRLEDFNYIPNILVYLIQIALTIQHKMHKMLRNAQNHYRSLPVVNF